MLKRSAFFPGAAPSVFKHWLSIFAVILLCCSGLSHAEGIQVKSAEIELVEDAYVLNADFDISFSAALEDAVSKGVPLHFIMEFEIVRPRWYWFDEKPVGLTQQYKLSYNALTRQYRMTIGTLYQNFPTFQDMIRVLGRIRGKSIGDKSLLPRGTRYEAALRLRLDASQLPKPFQVNALASHDWSLVSEWYRWSYTP